MRLGALWRKGTGADEYCVRVAVASDAELSRVRKLHQLRSYRLASVLRLGVVALILLIAVVAIVIAAVASS